MELLDQIIAYQVFGNTLLRWLLALVAFVATVLLLNVLRGVLARRVTRGARRNGFRWDRLLLELLGSTRGWLITAAGLFVATRFLEIAQPYEGYISQLFIILVILQVALWGNQAITYSVDQYKAREDLDGGRRNSLAALSFVGRLVLYSILGLLVLENLGVDITALVAGLGIGSIAVALAVQGILTDLFGSLSIIFDKPFEIGDYIVVGDLSGNVENIGLRTTRLRSLSGEQLVFANSDLLNSRIHNYKRMAERRVAFQVRVEYGTPRHVLEQIPDIIRQAVERNELVRFDRSHFAAFGPEALEFETVYYVLDSAYGVFMDIQQNINFEIYERFQEIGAPFALQARVVELRSGRQMPQIEISSSTLSSAPGTAT